MSQLSLFGSPSAASTKTVPAKPKRNHVGACVHCKTLICGCVNTDASSRIARRSDPESSKRAAKKLEVVLSWRQTFAWSAVKMMCNPVSPGMVVEVIASGGRTIEIELGDKSYTANEIALYAIQELDPSATQDTIRRRLSELVEKQLCVRSPVDQFCRFSGQEVNGYGIKPEVNATVVLKSDKAAKDAKAAKSKGKK